MAYQPYTNTYNKSNNLIAGKSQRARVGGSGFTVFTWQGNPISFARQISHQSPAPVGTGTVPIHPLDSPYPEQLITAQAITMGTLVLELYELYGANVWERLAGLGGNNTANGTNADSTHIVDLANIFKAVANDNPIHIYRIIQPPNFGFSKGFPAYTQEFHNCVVSTLDDGETIEVGTMEVLKRITVNYTHITQGGQNSLLSDSTSYTNTRGAPGTIPS